ncbi:bifunctional protein-serine/threonine kinase/phosphatase [Microbulbifer sp. OS29]|uniref:Bifunctional protein-serine/threonine kinase/phosphatase n=1 Tax=Microbulbifer okhotskensis TaxID=2926617 RepID=A0A9X2EQH7_9GAMM|nr:bifunctional protein-serine/threonine kinase/phosphatase [Microbulbifer okhotskensis]MCO1335920.1 bifunctional protein-serine/threonine kinase/phosphatase [Microbulbifer okhotskensis]
MSPDNDTIITAGPLCDGPAITANVQHNSEGALQLFSASCAGLRQHNDDACAVRLPASAELQRHGSLAAVADGVANAEAGGEAARAAINGFFSDYYSTPETWSTKHAVARVLHSLNSWLFRQSGGSSEIRRGWLTTFSAVIFKGTSAHLVHIGDSRIYRVRHGKLECLSRDHSHTLGPGRTFLSRALGMDAHIDVDYRCEELQLDDIFLISSDGIHDFLSEMVLTELLLDFCSSTPRQLIDTALQAGSTDNLSGIVCRVNSVGLPQCDELAMRNRELPFAPDLRPGQQLDRFLILQELHASSRSHLYLARDQETDALRVIKTPSVNFCDDPLYITRFIAEEWTGRRVSHPGIIKAFAPATERRCLYHILEYIEGQTLRQWMQLNPQPKIHQVRDLLGQLVSALRSLQRLEIVHGDLKPENIMMRNDGRLVIIDLGGADGPGLREQLHLSGECPPGSKNYAAPEFFFGDSASHRSDIFSLGVITYELLTGKYPYPERLGNHHYRLKSYNQMRFTNASSYRNDIPHWIDAALQKACATDPMKRYNALSEFVQDLQIPNSQFKAPQKRPLLERNPLLCWQLLALLLLLSHLLYFF